MKKSKLKRRMYPLFMAILGLIVFVALYSSLIEPKMLNTLTYGAKFDSEGQLIQEPQGVEFKQQKASEGEIRLVQISDIHLGAFYDLKQLSQLIAKINALNPDMVLFTGDLFDRAWQFDQVGATAKILAEIKCSHKYAIYGNHDYGGGGSRVYGQVMEDAGFQVLVNRAQVLELPQAQVVIYGADDALLGKPLALEPQDPGLAQALNPLGKPQIDVLMMHEPDATGLVMSKGATFDLAFSGHSHGGQIALPFWGPLVRVVLGQDYVKGWYLLAEGQGQTTALYVNTGIGNTRLPFRLGNVPQIAVIDCSILKANAQ